MSCLFAKLFQVSKGFFRFCKISNALPRLLKRSVTGLIRVRRQARRLLVQMMRFQVSLRLAILAIFQYLSIYFNLSLHFNFQSQVLSVQALLQGHPEHNQVGDVQTNYMQSKWCHLFFFLYEGDKLPLCTHVLGRRQRTIWVVAFEAIRKAIIRKVLPSLFSWGMRRPGQFFSG